MTSTPYAPLFILTAGLMVSSPSIADSTSTIETAGTIIAVAIPAAAYGSTYYKDDTAGRQQFYQSFGTTVATTYALKALIDKERPNQSNDNAFPSSHTSVAFQGAGFMHKRYGLEYSIPAYIGAGFVAYSRVEADEHDVVDVLAGAALGMASSFYLTTSIDEQFHIAPSLSPEYIGVQISHQH